MEGEEGVEGEAQRLAAAEPEGRHGGATVADADEEEEEEPQPESKKDK